MKIIFTIAFIFSLSVFCAQKNTSAVTVSLATASLKKARSIQELLPPLPDGCAIRTFEMILKVGERVLVYADQRGDTLAGKNEWRQNMGAVIAGETIQVEVKSATCPPNTPITRMYKIKVTGEP